MIFMKIGTLRILNFFYLSVATLSVSRAVVSTGALVNIGARKAVSRKSGVTSTRVAVSKICTRSVDIAIISTSGALNLIRSNDFLGFFNKNSLKKTDTSSTSAGSVGAGGAVVTGRGAAVTGCF